MSRNSTQFSEVEKLLLGRLNYHEVTQVLQSLKEDKELQLKLNAESSFEAAFYSQQWLESAPSLGVDMARWLSPESSATPINEMQKTDRLKRSDDRLVAGFNWEELIEKAFSQAQAPLKPSFIIPFSFKNLRVFSALILIFFIIASIFLFSTKKPPVSDKAPDSLDNYAAIDPFQGNQKQKTVLSDSIGITEINNVEPISVYDTINEYYAGKPIKSSISLPPQEKGVVYLSKNSGFLAEEGTDVTIINNSDSVVTLSMTKGSAVFTVEKNSYKRFAVITPFAEVRVVGTIFQVSVFQHKTNIKVVEGSVTITTIQGIQETLTLTKGKNVYVSEDSLVQDVIKRSKMLKQRENLLKSYLTYIHTTRADQFPVEYLLKALQAKIRAGVDSLATVFDPVLRAQLMHYRVAVNLSNDHYYEKAKNYLLMLYSERQAPFIDQLSMSFICLLELRHFEREQALKYMESYVDEFTDGYAIEEILMLYIQTCLAEGDYDRAIPYMVQLVQEHKESGFADYIAFHLAQTFRIVKKDLSSAMEYYEYITSNYPESSLHEDALYWAGWCLVQAQVHGKKNKYFRKYKKDYPDGNWRDVISNNKGNL